jgi:hypothetical protein
LLEKDMILFKKKQTSCVCFLTSCEMVFSFF